MSPPMIDDYQDWLSIFADGDNPQAAAFHILNTLDTVREVLRLREQGIRPTEELLSSAEAQAKAFLEANEKPPPPSPTDTA